ncbi:MAG: TIGR01777 family oxidoreductase [Flavobacteriaceae bacterium]|nr:TIGR01777 family oxidoreductase [Flavobacteriaceae bacterium]
MKVLITGATGLIGGEIVRQCLQKNWTVHYLTRSQDNIETKENYKGFLWNVDKQEIDIDCFSGVNKIINLVGAPITERWTDDNKAEILSSRVDSLKLLRKSIKKTTTDIDQIISASAIGVYPSSLTNYYKESNERESETYLGEVVEKWENEVDKFDSLGIKTTKIRIGLVLSEKDGALPKISKPIRYYGGAAFGSGEQWQSWIHLEDLARIFLFVAEHSISGVYNGVAPNPVTNETLTKEIANVLDKPLLLPNIPKIFMKVALGEMHIILFESQRVSSEKIESEGFNFNYPNLHPALVDLLK